MGGGAGKQQQYKAAPDPALRQQPGTGGPTLQQRPSSGAGAQQPTKELKADDTPPPATYGADRKQQGAPLSVFQGAEAPPVSPPRLHVATVKCVAEFHAKVDDVVDWESISGPAMRHAVPMLLELEGEQKCDAWMWRPMHYAAIYGAAEAVEALARAGAAVDSRTGGHGLLGKALSRGSFNFSAVIECSLSGPREMVRAVEVNGDCVTVVQQHTRARKTVDLESCTCVGYSTGQQPNHARRFGFATPLHIAIEFQHVDTIHALLACGANPNNAWNENRDRPLHTAVAQGNDQAVEALLHAKADPNAEDSWGRVPLVVAAVCAKQPTADVAVLLLDANARQGATDRSGKTAAQLAREAGHSEFANAVEQYDINERADMKAARMAELERQRLELEEQRRREDEERARREAIEEARRKAEEEARRHAEIEWQRKMEEEAKARAEAEERARLEQEERDREAQERGRREAEREERERERREAAERAFAEAEEKARRQKEEAEELERQQEEQRARREAEEREREQAEQERLAAEAADERARQENAEREAQRLAEEEAARAAEERERQEAEEKARLEAEEKALREEEERLRREEEEARQKRGEGQRELCQRWLIALARGAAVAGMSKRREAWHREFAKVRSDRWDRAIARPPLDATTGRMIASSQRTDLLREGGLIKEANKLEAELRRKGVNLERMHAKWSRMAELSKLTPEEATTIIVREFGAGE